MRGSAASYCIHVVLDVVVHLPVDEANERIQGKRTATQSIIRYLIFQADVLRVVAEKSQPSAVKRRERRKHRYNPQSEREKHSTMWPLRSGAERSGHMRGLQSRDNRLGIAIDYHLL